VSYFLIPPGSVGITTTSSQASSSINNGHSGAAISGTIVGPICGVALILGLAFLFFRRGRNKPAQFESSSHVQSPPPPGLAHFEGYPGDKPELAATNPLNPRPVSVSPTYRGTVMAASTSIPRKEVPSPTASYDTQHPMSLSGPGQQGVAPYGQQHSQIDEMPATEPPF
jgi:hypothetical protein